MPDIELIIKMPKIEYEHLTNRDKFSSLEENKQTWLINKTLNRVAEGTLIPEGHGRIADMDAAIKCIEEVKGEDATWAIALIEWACGKRTLIEADKTEDEAREGLEEPEAEDVERE